MAETVNDFPITDHQIIVFTSNVMMALAKKGGRLASLVSVGQYKGEKVQAVKIIGHITFSKRDTVNRETRFSDVQHKQRWLTADDYDAAVPVDNYDLLRMLDDPTNPYVEALRLAAGRLEDVVIMEAMYADAMTGVRGGTLVSFTAGNIIAASATGLTVAKLRSARKLLKQNYVDLEMERPIIGVHAAQTDNLLGETVIGSADYNSVKPLVDGEVGTFMGFTFVPMEGFVPVTSTTRRCPVWVPSGVHLGNWAGLTIRVGDRPDLNYLKQIHATRSLGATRIMEEKVLEIDCVES